MAEKAKENENTWLDIFKKNTKYDIVLIKNAYLFAQSNTNKNFALYSNDSFKFGLSMADILISLNCDSHVIAAAILYPVLFLNAECDTTLKEKIENHFDQAVVKLIFGALRMEAIHQNKSKKEKLEISQNQINHLRKMLLAMVDDIRTVLIKLAERLVLLKNLKLASIETQEEIAQDTMNYYAPLANRLGIGHIKWQLEDAAFHYLNPHAYQSISTALNMRRQDREKVIIEMISELKKLFQQSDIDPISVSVTGRAKHIYSIYRKIQKKQVGFEDIYDASALRLLVPTIHDCYTALSLIHAKWDHVDNEFDDYIAKPKSNGYQSIHTVIIREDKIAVEIQIRTVQMHESAELGIAAHWKYKENQTHENNYENKIAWLRKVMRWQSEISEAEASAKLYQEAFKDRVYVFSKTGDVFDLSAGATPLDFAYLVHTDIGHRCRGAKVNNALVPLTYILQTGDRIEILTTKLIQPSRDWIRSDLGYLKTPAAIQKVKHWFRKQTQEKEIETGLLLFEKAARLHHLQKNDLLKVLPDFNHQSVNSLLAALGSGDITFSAILHKLNLPKEKIKSDAVITIKPTSQHHENSFDFSAHGMKYVLTQIAKCCNPIPGDAIIGYITQGRGISVHQTKCRNIKRAQKNNIEKLIAINWEHSENKNFNVNIEIISEDRNGLLRDISGLLTQLKLSISALHSNIDKKNNSVFIVMTVEVSNQDALNTVLQKLKHIHGVFEVTRK